MIGIENAKLLLNANNMAEVLNSKKEEIQTNDSFQERYQNLQTPKTLDSIFEEAAQVYHVDVNLLKAIGKAESDFDANAKSSAGAMGIMQLMPATAREYGITNPYDPKQNIMGGAREISTLLKRYDGDLELALAGYNAGIGNVAKYGGVPPFRETQNYIKKVTSYLQTPITTGKTIQNNTVRNDNIQNEIQVASSYEVGQAYNTITSIPVSYGQAKEIANLGSNAILSEMNYQKTMYYMLEQMKYNMDITDSSLFSLESENDII